MKDGLIDYFPISRALVLKNTTDDDERFHELRNMMKAMIDKFGSFQVIIANNMGEIQIFYILVGSNAGDSAEIVSKEFLKNY